MKKVLLIAGICLVALVVIVLLAGYLLLNHGVKAAIETGGPQMTKTNVSVAGVSLSPFSGSGQINDLSVGNPEGFKGDHAVNVRQLSVNLKVSTVLSDPLVIDSLHIDSPDVIYETGSGGSNIDAIMKNVEAFSAQRSSEPSRKVIIRDFRLTNGKVRLSSLLTANQAAPVPVPDLHLTGIGEKTNGATLQEVAAEIMKPLGQGLTGACSQMTGLLRNAGDMLKPVDKATKGLKLPFGK
jgi:hypothetical protein